MRILGIIPARSGSKGIPHKNIRPLAGKPLIGWTLEAARQASFLSDILVSTDSAEYLKVAGQFGHDWEYVRPAALADDETPMAPVIDDAAGWWEQQTGKSLNAVCLLQPTSPFRTAEHIDEGCRRFVESKADSLVSVVPVPHNMLPQKLMKQQDGWLVPYAEGPMLLHRHAGTNLWARNGPVLLITRRDIVRNGDALYGPRTIGFEMSPDDSIDLDNEEDWARAEHLLRWRLERQSHEE